MVGSNPTLPTTSFMKKYYSEITLKPSILNSLNPSEDLNWKSIHGWDVVEVPKEVWSLENLLSRVNSEFPINRVAILNMGPFQNYMWHADDYRGVAINMLLSHTRSHCLFGYSKDNDNMFFEELIYKPNTFYLFNTQQFHTIINFEDYRYMLSVEFIQDKSELNYYDIYWWARNNNLIVPE